MSEIIGGGSYADLLDTVPNMTEALRRCYLLAGQAPESAAWELKIDYCHFSRMMRSTDSRSFPPDKIELLMKKMGNQFPLDWLAHRMGLVCYPLELMQVLDGIKAALQAEGRPAKFAVAELLRAVESLRAA